MKTNELTGAALDWAVGIANGWITYPTDSIEQGQYFHTNPAIAPLGHQHNRVLVENYTPSTNWAQGGPIIEREQIGTLFDSGSACHKPCWFATPDDQSISCSYEGEFFDPTFMVTESFGRYGPTPLIAAMRCYVASKLGDEVALPDGL